MAERTSALAGHVKTGHIGAEVATGVILEEVADLSLQQVAAWPDTLAAVGAKAAGAIGLRAAGARAALVPAAAVTGPKGALLRTEPLKWWLLDAAAPSLTPEEGTTLDLSHSRVRVRISGPEAAALLNRHLPLDLREGAFPAGSVASTAFHHVGITLWRAEAGYELFLPRGFALSLWELLLESAAQFGAEVAYTKRP